MDQLELPKWCGIMDSMGVTPEMRARLTKAGRNYTRAREAFDKARADLVGEIVAARREGTLIEDIAACVPYRQTQVNRVLEAAGLTEKRPKRDPS